jgi:hypothetical protein
MLKKILIRLRLYFILIDAKNVIRNSLYFCKSKILRSIPGEKKSFVLLTLGPQWANLNLELNILMKKKGF